MLFQARNVVFPVVFLVLQALSVNVPLVCFIVSGSKRQFKCVKFVITMNLDFIVIMVPLGPGR